MSDKKQTAVSWLIEKLTERYVSDITPEEWFGIMGQAKQFEREQIEQAYGDGLNAHRTNFCNRNEYYEQTYGKHDS